MQTRTAREAIRLDARRATLARGVLGLALVALLGGIPASSETVYADAESVEPLAVGASVPKAELTDLDGAKVDIASLVADRGALLVFYRGGW